MATALEHAIGWVETEAPELTGKTAEAIVARLKQFEVPKVPATVAWFEAVSDEELADRVGNGERFCIEAFAIFRWGNRVELRNHYGYTIRKRTLNVQ